MRQDVSSLLRMAGSPPTRRGRSRDGMSIRLKIILYQLVVAIMLLSSAAATYIAIERIDYYFDRTRLARQQMDTVIRLSAHMNRYSENIAELLLLGRTELDDFYTARSSLEEGLAHLTTLIEQEIAFVRSAGERARESEELVRVDQDAGTLREHRPHRAAPALPARPRPAGRGGRAVPRGDRGEPGRRARGAHRRRHRRRGGGAAPAREPDQRARAAADSADDRRHARGAPRGRGRRRHADPRADPADPRADRRHAGDRRGQPQLPHRLRPQATSSPTWRGSSTAPQRGSRRSGASFSRSRPGSRTR